MDFEKIDPNDPMDEMLRQYLLEKNPKGLKGDSLMEEAAFGDLSRGPSFAPDGNAESEVISRLNQALSQMPPNRRFPFWIPASVAAAAAVALFVVFKLGQVNPGVQQIASNPGFQSRLNPESSDNNPTLLNSTDPLHSDTSASSLSLPSSTQNVNPGDQTDIHLTRDFHQNPGDTDLNLNYSSNPTFAIANPVVVSDFIGRFGPSEKNYSLPSEEGGVIESATGALVWAPPSAFLYSDGRPVSGTVDLRVTESSTLSSMIRAGIQLGTQMQNLSIASAVKIEAWQQGKPLRLAPGKEIFVEIPGTVQSFEYQVLGLEPGPQGKPVIAGRADHSIVPVSLRKLHFEEFWCTDHRDIEWNKYITMIEDPANEGTFLSSVQFRERIQAAWELGHVGQILKLYLDNRMSNLWQSDKMVADRIASGEIRTHGNEAQAEKTFRQLSLQGYEKAILGIPSNVDLDKPGTLQMLKSKGLSVSDASQVIRMHRIRMRNQKALDYSSPVGNDSWGAPAQMGAYNLNRLGWLAFVKPVSARQSKKIDLKFSGVTRNEIISVLCVQTDRRSLHSGVLDEHTAALEVPSVPSNSWIVGLAYRDGKPFLAMQKIYNGISNDVVLNFRETDYAGLKAELTSVDY